MSKLYWAPLLAASLLLGCASNPSADRLSTDQRASYDSLQLFYGPSPRPHTVLGSVDGLSCYRNAYGDDVTEYEATEGVKVKAAMLEADAVANLTCETSGMNLVTNCWAQMVCTGEAISFTE